ncbi:MAG: hypothetical protein IGS23_03345 [Rivularia sp. T60_A2020_040]|nr:hypothetical protein [Rivularia sp. T60_A2020_040]
MSMMSNHKRFFTGIVFFVVTLVITILTAINISPTLAQQQVSLTVSSLYLQNTDSVWLRKHQQNYQLNQNYGAGYIR